jgi:flagellar secretion chaperone FliS
MNAYSNAYQQNQMATSSPEQILIMLYDGAIRFTVRAREALAGGDMLQKAESISRAMAIVTTFSDTLDHETGAGFADELDALYHFMVRELTRANLHNDPKPLEAVETLLRDLRETWQQAIDINREEQLQLRAEASEHQAKQLRASL